MSWLIDYNHDPNMDIKYFFGWRPAYLNACCFDKPIGVEVGVLEGFLTKLALKYVDFGKYYLVDPYKEYTIEDVGDLHLKKQEFWDNLFEKTKERFKDDKRVEMIRKTSEEAVNDFKDNSLDFVYIDAEHSYDSVWKDVNLWFPKVKEGGYICGHDIDMTSVKSAVYRFYFEIYGEMVTKEFIEGTIATGYNDWWMKKICKPIS